MNAQDLKNSILQLAIQGKLVEQREGEGTAKELLEKIKAEKKQLVKKKVIKRQKNLPEITEEEIDFEIPPSWEWTRLEAITYSIGNKSNQIKQSEILQEGRYPVVSQSMNRIEGYSNEENKLLNINSLSVIVFGDHSKTLKLIDFDFIIGADGTKIMVPIAINPEYLFYILNYNIINMRDRGYSRHFQFLKEKLIPLPPLEEQKRIVAKIEELMPYLNKYDVAYSEVVELNKKFPEDMQKSILQYAIQGKLVEQREEDGTAEELYKQIQEEKKKLIKEGKIKKTKALPEIAEDEIPFEIPENWKWVCINDVAFVTKLAGFEYTKYMSNAILPAGEIPLVRAKNIKPNNFMENEEEFITRELSEKLSRCALDARCILMTFIGAGIGEVAIFENKRRNHLAPNVAKIVPHIDINDYLLYYFMSYTGQREIFKYMKRTAQPSLSMETIRKVIIPLPPLSEQKRIVDKIEEMLPYTNQLIKKTD